VFPARGLKGEPLRNFVNDAVLQPPLDKLKRNFAVVATDLKSGEMVLFRSGDTGMGGTGLCHRARRVPAGDDQRPRVRRWRSGEPGAGARRASWAPTS
jgi:hypothetical protein